MPSRKPRGDVRRSAADEKDPFLRALGLAIAERRTAAGEGGRSQEQLAADADVHRTYVGGVERAERNPSVLMLVRLARALKVEPSVLLGEAEAIATTRSMEDARVADRLGSGPPP